jgi:hypothetical protein
MKFNATSQLLQNRHDRLRFGRELLKGRDPRSAALSLFEESGYYLKDGGRIYKNKKLDYDSPWVYVNFSRNVKCILWHNAIYHYFGFIPSPCHDCFKVVVRPGTLRELFALHKIFDRLQLQYKLGIELREFVHGLYGIYFYNIGIQEGLDIYSLIKDAVCNSSSTDIPVILKRGCTRYEQEVGPSDEWMVTPEQLELEFFLKENISPDILSWDSEPYSQPEILTNYIQKRWIHWAYQNGDSTYLDFSAGQHLFRPAVTYHDDTQAVHKVISSRGADRS